MRTLWKTSLALSLGVLVTGARGEEVVWRQAAPSTAAAAPGAPPAARASAAQLQRPIAQAAPAPAPIAPAAVLGKPIAIAGAGRAADANIQPVTFSQADGGGPLVRGQAPDYPLVRPMPSGAPVIDTSARLQGWSRADSAPTPLAIASAPPSPRPGPGPVAGPFVAYPTIGDPNCDGCVGGACPCPTAPVCKGGACPCPTAAVCDGGPCPCSTGAVCDGCMNKGCCPPGNRFYGGAEYLLWWVKGSSLPPLVTSSSTNIVPSPASPPFNGALDSSLTSMLFGGSQVGTGPRSGLRGQLGYWFDDCHLLGIEVGGFFLGNKDNNFFAESLGTSFLGRPFVNAANGRQDVEITAAQLQGTINGIPITPFLVAGSIDVRNTSSFWGAGANLRSNLLCGCSYYVDALLGFRTLALDESLSITETVVVPPGASFPSPTGGVVMLPMPISQTLRDRFAVQNRFYGANVGLDSNFQLGGRWSLGVKGQVALGTTQQLVTITGSTATNVLGATQVFPGGLLAQPTNSGRFTRDAFTVVPEAGLNIGYQFTNHLRGTIGYNFLYWSSVARPGDQIDLVVNRNQLQVPRPTTLVDPARPAFAFHNSDFWAQGLTLGLEFRW